METHTDLAMSAYRNRKNDFHVAELENGNLALLWPANLKPISEAARGFRHAIIGRRRAHGLCYIICSALEAYLNAIEQECQLVNGVIPPALNASKTIWVNHVWIKYGSIIIDPTADQFINPNGKRMPKVYIGPKPDWYKENDFPAHPKRKD